MSTIMTWLHPVVKKTPIVWSTASYMVSILVASLAKIWLGNFNKATVFNKKQFLHLVENRSEKQGLVTVSNHFSCADDPLMWGMIPWKNIFGDRKYWRWIPSAEEICFPNYITALFFSLGRCVPVRRGDGVYQRGMDFCLDRLSLGDWVHMFPEGKVNMEQDYMRIKWGVGRLISECTVAPIVLPVYHIGIDSILPNQRPYIPQIRKDVTIVVGEPLDYTDILVQLRNLSKTPTEIRRHITDDIQDKLFKLRLKAEDLHDIRLCQDDV